VFLPHAFGFNLLRTGKDLQGSIRAGFCRAACPSVESSAPIPLARALRRARSAPVRAGRQSCERSSRGGLRKPGPHSEVSMGRMLQNKKTARIVGGPKLFV
jgi:hypothetical protein